MISAQNHLQPSSGNRYWILFAILFVFISCGSYKAKKNRGVNSQTETVESAPGVVIVTDDKASTQVAKPSKEEKIEKKTTQAAKTSKVYFRGESFEITTDILNNNPDEIRVVYALPFCFEKTGRSVERIREIMLEYIEGAELAVNELVKQGHKIKVDVFDTENSARKVEEFLQTETFKKAHLIIGPVFEEEFAPMEKFCSVYQIPLVNPLRQYEKKLRTSLHVFNPVVTDTNRHYLAALNLIELYPQARFVVINTTDKDAAQVRIAYQRAFKEKLKALAVVSLGELKAVIDQKVELVILCPSSSEAEMRSVTNLSSGKNFVKVVGQEEWFDFSIIPFEQWEKSNLLFYTNYFVNHNSEEVKKVKEEYAYLFGGIPGKYSYIAYDHSLFFVEAVSAFGVHFGEFLHTYNFPLIHNNFNFKRKDNEVYKNMGINILELQNFEQVRIN